MLKIVGEFSETFRKHQNDRLFHFSIFPSIYIWREFFESFRKHPQNVPKIFSQVINSMINGWTVYTKNIKCSLQSVYKAGQRTLYFSV